MSAGTIPKHILAIHAHPDDVEFLCAGTLARLRERGHQVTIATMTPGDAGSVELSRFAIAQIRREEAKKAADLIGANYHCLEFRDLEIVWDNPSRRYLTEFLRRTRPDIILTASPIDYMSDHEVTSRLVRDASFNASIRNYQTGSCKPAGTTDHLPYLYYVDAIEGTDAFGRPIPAEFHIDISEVFETKRAMLACHDSQRAWLRKQHGMDEYLEAQERWSAHRGREIGVTYAEAFRQHLGHPYPHDNLLQSLLD